MHSKTTERNGRWAVVTGASSGIGLALARGLAARGYDLFMVSRDAEQLETAARSVRETCGVQTRCCPMDLAVPGAAEALFERCREAAIRPHVLVNDAGTFIYNDILDTAPERIDRILCLHMRTVTMLCRLFGEEMAADGGGYILNMASYSLWMPWPGIALYSSTKAYVRSFSIAFAKEMRERNVGVTAISPAGVATDFYGLSRGLQRLGCRLGVLMTPEKVARKALRALFARRRHIVPGWYNRLFIPFCTGMPDPCVRLIRRKTARFRH